MTEEVLIVVWLLAGIIVGLCLYKAGYYMGRADQLLEDTKRHQQQRARDHS